MKMRTLDPASLDLSNSTVSAESLVTLALDASPCGVLLMGPSGTITLANRALEEMFGYSRGELIGRSVDVLLPGTVRAADEIHRDGYLIDAQASPMSARRDLFGRRQDGTEVAVELGLNSLPTTSGLLVLATVLDISEQHRRDEEYRLDVEERLAFERLVSELSARFVNLPPSDVDRVIEDAQRQLCEALALDRSALYQVSDNGGDFLLTHHWERHDDLAAAPNVSGNREFPWSHARLVKGQVACFSSVDEIPHAAERECVRRYGNKSRVAVPVSIGGKIIGSITFSTTRQPRTWDQQVLDRLQLIAQVFANALGRKHSDAALQAAVGEIAHLRDLLQAENLYLRREVQERLGASAVVGRSPAVRRVLEQIEQVASTDSTVLLLGETGTGKELFATQIHERSARRAQTMVRVNCAAIPATLIESELFGREKGAYTGALARQIGRFEVADRSTIFLDEIGDLPPDVQVKLLRVLEEKRIERLGSPKSIPVDTRIIAATHRDLDQLMAEGTFREDLYYRLNVFPIRVPPLRDRTEDIPLLVWRFVQEFSQAFGKPIEAIGKENMVALTQYTWPGNIRELRNVVERAMIVATGPRLTIPVPRPSASAKRRSVRLVDVECDHIRTVLESTNWRIRGAGGAAERLGMKPTTLETRLMKLGLKRPERL
jgi:formate hydrogenlyase transcriptional activator